MTKDWIEQKNKKMDKKYSNYPQLILDIIDSLTDEEKALFPD